MWCITKKRSEMQMKKKTILFLCIIFIFISILSACGQDKAESKENMG